MHTCAAVNQSAVYTIGSGSVAVLPVVVHIHVLEGQRFAGPIIEQGVLAGRLHGNEPLGAFALVLGGAEYRLNSDGQAALASLLPKEG